MCVYVSLPLLMCAVFYFNTTLFSPVFSLIRNSPFVSNKSKIVEEEKKNSPTRIHKISISELSMLFRTIIFCCCCFLLVHSFCSLFMLFAGLKRMLNMPEIDRQNRTEHKITRIIGVLGGSRPRLL